MKVRSSYVARSTPPSGLRLADVLGALSHALDLTEGQPPGHCKRCAWIGTHVGRAYGLRGTDLDELFFTLLLKDLGCSSNAARICELYLADDINFKREFKLVDGSMSAALRFVLAQTGLKAGLAERFRTLINVIQEGGEIAREMIETRCHRGADIAAKMRFSEAVQDGIRSLDEHWNGAGRPQGLAGEAIPLFSRIALLSQVADVFYMTRGRAAAVREIVARSGRWFDPDLVEAFTVAQRDVEFWPTPPDRFEEDFAALAPDVEAARVDESYLDDIASAFADVIDAKSPFTAGHSERVMLFGDMISEELGLGPAHRRWLRRAALLHDIGKLAVSNSILDKPGRPDEAEWEVIRSHPAHSRSILSRVSVFADLAADAGAHHEKLDGTGYPDGLSDATLSLEARVLAVADVFDALSAERPYRAAMPIPQALAIMDRDAGTHFDEDCLAALKRALTNAAMADAA